MADHDAKAAEKGFSDAVNMTAKELRDWLGSDDSKAVGQKSGGGGESTGHEYGRRIVGLLEKHRGDYTDSDRDHMRKVTGYVKRHLAQKPSKEDVETSKWRYSLMNWGHDPLK